MSHTFQSEDYVLRWPRDLFRTRLTDLINGHLDGSIYADWTDQVELLLDDAFESKAPGEAFRSRANQGETAADPWTEDLDAAEGGREFLGRMLRATDTFPHEVPSRPYWSQRGRGIEGAEDAGISLKTAVSRFVRLVSDFENRGYFEDSFGKNCIDDPATTEPAALIQQKIGKPGLWPLSRERLDTNQDLFLDVIEVLGDLAAAPQRRDLHPYLECGWHHKDFNRSRGRAIYYWQVNKLLDQTSFSLQLATSGEDRGRLIRATDDARNDLVKQTVEGTDEAARDSIEHAIALFRKRDATPEDTRSACLTLARLLESRRPFLKQNLLKEDEGALFQIANKFDLRHQTASQQDDYDPAFLDWIFWWYLATIELTDRIFARRTGT